MLEILEISISQFFLRHSTAANFAYSAPLQFWEYFVYILVLNKKYLVFSAQMTESNTKANNAAANANLQIIRDPAMSKHRVFIGNLPVCTREQLESICVPYGKVIGSLVQKNYGFVQFESEEIANKVASALNRSTFKGHTITVRNAGSKQQATAAAKRAATVGNAASTFSGGGDTSKLIPGGSLNTNPDYNDCEIIVVDRKNTKYAELIEERLKRLKLRVDVLFPNEDVALGKVLGNISSRGCLYAVLVTNQHEEHNSITVNILYGQPAEHRNMPVEDAIQLIAEDFRAKLLRDAANNAQHLPKAVPIIAAGNMLAPPLKERHPDAVQILLSLLADNMPLTVLQYDRIIKYLQDRRELQLRVELGDTSDQTVNVPDPEIELQKKILNILNKPSVAETHYNLLYPNLQAISEDYRALNLLKDERVQKALDSLMDSSLVSTVSNYMKF